ncbi:Acetyltransferase (GNAT) domain-containing protein [Dyadobacter sp. SG02]|uniref:GNAT family N-acetyltransferase n=1 Tax=Dyadobacter sp. SG02 TaxID=1855291 RepID=UPI0008BA3CCF|nr:GNAT family N-acetyltransferase [Dyadobacter sp. SG02]SEI98042.1 Acetyltransferase (GNAT) domain-containing protein [Dyadobacter sp. SG02]
MICQEFTEGDIAYLPALEPEGWGDIRPRFEYFLRSECCKPIKIEENGQPVAVGTSIFHADTVWLACIITHAEHRKKGLGAAITRHLIENVDRNRYPTIYLDATEFGYPVYLKQGFEVEGQYAHLRREDNVPELTHSANIQPFTENFREAAYALDRMVSGEDRRGVMAEFLADAIVYLGSKGDLQGVYLPSWSDGPIIAANDEAGFALIRLRAQVRPVAILPLSNTEGLKYLQEIGYNMYRTSRRMILGPSRVWQPERLHNRISGALG